MSEEWRVQVAEEANYQPGGFWLTWPEQELAA
jgi:hypothetical protein